MATITFDCASSSASSFLSNGKLQLTYTAENGTFTLTELAGKRNDGYRSYNQAHTSVTVTVNGVSKTVSLGNYIDFNTSWATWNATDTSWTGITGTTFTVTVTMPSSTTAYNGATFTGSITQTWSGVVKIYNGSSWVSAIPYVYNGSEWKQCIPYVYNGSEWKICT